MPGKLYDGRDVTTAKNGVPQNSKAYCDGLHYRAGGTAAERPKTDNPHQSGSELETAWDAGWDAADAAASGDGTISAAQAGPCGGRGQSVSA